MKTTGVVRFEWRWRKEKGVKGDRKREIFLGVARKAGNFKYSQAKCKEKAVWQVDYVTNNARWKSRFFVDGSVEFMCDSDSDRSRQERQLFLLSRDLKTLLIFWLGRWMRLLCCLCQDSWPRCGCTADLVVLPPILARIAYRPSLFMSPSDSYLKPEKWYLGCALRNQRGFWTYLI